MRYKRSERIVFMTQYLMNHPNQLIPLTFVKNLNKRSLQLVKMFKLLRILSKRKARYSYYDCRCEWWCNLQTNDE